MPKHSIGATYADDAGSVPLTPTTYVIPAEVNMLLPVPAGAVNTEFDVPFLHGRVVAYVLSVGTQTTAQIASATYSEAAAGSLLVNVNSTSTPVPAITIQAKQPHVFAPCLEGTVNEFTADVTKFFISNAGASPLVLIVKIALNS